MWKSSDTVFLSLGRGCWIPSYFFSQEMHRGYAGWEGPAQLCWWKHWSDGCPRQAAGWNAGVRSLKLLCHSPRLPIFLRETRSHGGQSLGKKVKWGVRALDKSNDDKDYLLQSLTVNFHNKPLYKQYNSVEFPMRKVRFREINPLFRSHTTATWEKNFTNCCENQQEYGEVLCIGGWGWVSPVGHFSLFPHFYF